MDLSELNDIELRKDSQDIHTEDTPFAGLQFSLLDEPTKRALVRQAQAGDIAARNKLIEHDMPLIIQLAGRYLDKGLSLDDIVQAGVIGMMQAIDRFDLERGVKLNTYTVPYIMKDMREALYMFAKTIRMPRHKYDLLYVAKKARATFEEKHGRLPSLYELAAAVGEKPYLIDEVLRFDSEPMALHLPPAGGQWDAPLEEAIEDEQAAPAGARLQAERVKALLPQYIARLKPQYQTFVIRRFGLDGEPEMLLEEVGQVLGVSRARAGQVQILALKALREMIEKDGLSLSDLL